MSREGEAPFSRLRVYLDRKLGLSDWNFRGSWFALGIVIGWLTAGLVWTWGAWTLKTEVDVVDLGILVFTGIAALYFTARSQRVLASERLEKDLIIGDLKLAAALVDEIHSQFERCGEAKAMTEGVLHDQIRRIRLLNGQITLIKRAAEHCKDVVGTCDLKEVEGLLQDFDCDCTGEMEPESFTAARINREAVCHRRLIVELRKAMSSVNRF
jgi:hypothetical protein